ncbi:lactococcin 972 family bacteriocin [Heyndrickxia sporothermodurans]|uniref:lactococcin 972 family bacteriocin n=1 Tax=Heyndrickxia sporothermodurans TaxID=46224 RepID=UPI002DC012B5|nr:lactococcin 972 family bacteriocin [Heyndrickxia sporothermodurans]MEB6551497.1 lactococcin 972 family bacteriocin [Heyndrickxia sporothermodurans]
MKKKIVTFALTGIIALSVIIPVTTMAADSWDYGINKSVKPIVWYNNYYHSDYKHYGSITKNDVQSNGSTTSAGYWSRLNLEVTGPYLVSYSKHIKK